MFWYSSETSPFESQYEDSQFSQQTCSNSQQPNELSFIPSSDDETPYSSPFVPQAAVDDDQIFFATSVDVVKTWVYSRFHGQGQMTSQDYRNLTSGGLLIVPLSHVGIIRKSRFQRGLVWLPRNDVEAQLRPELCACRGILNR